MFLTSRSQAHNQWHRIIPIWHEGTYKLVNSNFSIQNPMDLRVLAADSSHTTLLRHEGTSGGIVQYKA